VTGFCDLKAVHSFQELTPRVAYKITVASQVQGCKMAFMSLPSHTDLVFSTLKPIPGLCIHTH